jgi:coproporphyrinogen III oxidase
MNKNTIENWYRNLQDKICSDLETLDGGAVFHEDAWDRSKGGGGRSRVIENGKLIEKGGVNFSAVYGPTPEKILKALKLTTADFYATGVSIVLHPKNPWVPIIHMNIRYFEMSNGTYWFGGGIDLTPHYVFPEDGGYLHGTLKSVCDQTDPEYYPRFKKWADDYFYIKHRKETRGVGGIFFDRLSEESEGKPFEDLWAFTKRVGESFVPLYEHFANKYRNKKWTEGNRKWQLIRRGRYAEFNLVWDKGTKFGLDTDGRTESILMSLPPFASWKYNHTPTEGSMEADTLSWLKKDIDWIRHV